MTPSTRILHVATLLCTITFLFHHKLVGEDPPANSTSPTPETVASTDQNFASTPPPVDLNAVASTADPNATAVPTQAPQSTPDAGSGSSAFADVLQSNAPPASIAPAGSEPIVKSERLQGPDTIELAEDKPNIITNSSSELAAIFKKVDEPLASISKTIGDLVKLREDAYKQYFELDASIDEALQSSGFNKGNVEEIRKPLL